MPTLGAAVIAREGGAAGRGERNASRPRDEEAEAGRQQGALLLLVGAGLLLCLAGLTLGADRPDPPPTTAELLQARLEPRPANCSPVPDNMTGWDWTGTGEPLLLSPLAARGAVREAAARARVTPDFAQASKTQ